MELNEEREYPFNVDISSAFDIQPFRCQMKNCLFKLLPFLAFSIWLKERGNENWAQMDEVRIMLDYSENCQIQSIS